MGTAWASSLSYPWEDGLYVGGIETVKVNLTLRIYSNLWHVYAGLAILNPHGQEQIKQYAKSTTELFKIMLKGGEEGERELRERVEWAKERVFPDHHDAGEGTGKRRLILLSQTVLDKFSLGKLPPAGSESNNADGTDEGGGGGGGERGYRPNSHLSLLAMVDTWAHLNIRPYHHLSLAATPLFRLFLGVAEHLFLSPSLLSASIHSAMYDTWHRSDDLEFCIAARGWSQCVSFGSFEVYKRRFGETREFLESRFGEGTRLGVEMVRMVSQEVDGLGGDMKS